MICVTECIKAKCLSAPVLCDQGNYTPTPQELIIGVLVPDTDYTLYIREEGSEVTKKINLTSDSSGNISFDMNDYPRFFHENAYYTAWVTLRDAGMEEREDISFGPYDIYPCITLEFQRLSEDSETPAGLASQTVTI